jgi:hypothetical protein
MGTALNDVPLGAAIIMISNNDLVELAFEHKIFVELTRPGWCQHDVRCLIGAQ